MVRSLPSWTSTSLYHYQSNSSIQPKPQHPHYQRQSIITMPECSCSGKGDCNCGAGCKCTACGVSAKTCSSKTCSEGPGRANVTNNRNNTKVPRLIEAIIGERRMQTRALQNWIWALDSDGEVVWHEESFRRGRSRELVAVAKSPCTQHVCLVSVLCSGPRVFEIPPNFRCFQVFRY